MQRETGPTDQVRPLIERGGAKVLLRCGRRSGRVYSGVRHYVQLSYAAVATRGGAGHAQMAASDRRGGDGCLLRPGRDGARAARRFIAGTGFEIASVRMAAGGRSSLRIGPDRIVATNVSLTALVLRAYGYPKSRVVGLPAWADSALFDIDAKSSAEASSDEIDAMLRTLLRQRFRLEVERIKRDVKFYVLSVIDPDGKLGAGLRPSTTDCSLFREEFERWNRTRVGRVPSDPDCQTQTEWKAGTVCWLSR